MVPGPTRHELMLLSEARKLWDAPAKLELDDEDLLRDFCNDVLEFQTTISLNHPLIKFGNLTALRLSLSSGEPLLRELVTTLRFLSIQDLGIEDCVETQDFMGNAVKMLAPSLQRLIILRVHYDASAIVQEDQDVSPLQTQPFTPDSIFRIGRGSQRLPLDLGLLV